jgi:hypothetical protein
VNSINDRVGDSVIDIKFSSDGTKLAALLENPPLLLIIF